MPGYLSPHLLRTFALVAVVLGGATQATAQGRQRSFTRADSLRGSTTAPARTWWDVTFYDLRVALHPADSTIAGSNTISYRVVRPATEMQIDLMAPLVADSFVQDGKALPFRQDGDAWFVSLTSPQQTGTLRSITAYYHGRPKRLPNDGFHWSSDSLGRPWLMTVDQGVGSSIWWPLKDSWADEPDSQRTAITLPDPLIQVGPGQLRNTIRHDNGTTTWEYVSTAPINAYAVNITAGHFAHFTWTYAGEQGNLTLDFYPLDYHLVPARR